MAQSVKRLRAAQVARIQSPVPARPTISVEKLALFCNPTSEGTRGARSVKELSKLRAIASSLGISELTIRGSRPPYGCPLSVCVSVCLSVI
jgi:hypothetical protein